MKPENTKPMRVYPDDEFALRKICAERYLQKLDRRELNPARMLKAALRIPRVKEILMRAEIKDVRKK